MKTPEEIKQELYTLAYRFSGWLEGETAEDALAYIKQLEEAVPRWISVKDRMPEPYNTYIVALKEKFAWDTEWRYHVDVADLRDEGGYIEDKWDTFNDWYEGQEIHITHWMPMPEPPKEG